MIIQIHLYQPSPFREITNHACNLGQVSLRLDDFAPVAFRLFLDLFPVSAKEPNRDTIANKVSVFRVKLIDMRKKLLFGKYMREVMILKKLKILASQVVGISALDTERKRVSLPDFLERVYKTIKSRHKVIDTGYLLFIEIFEFKLGEEDPVMKVSSCVQVFAENFRRKKIGIRDKRCRFIAVSLMW